MSDGRSLGGRHGWSRTSRWRRSSASTQGSWSSPAHRHERVPTLHEVIDALRPTRTGLLVELKATASHPGLAADVAQAIAAVPGYVDHFINTNRLTVQSFDHHAALTHKQLLPEVPVGALGAPPVPELGTYALWAAEINPTHWTVTASYIEVVHRHGMRCNVWTVDRSTHMRRAIGIGVDGVITNRPRALRELVAQHHLACRRQDRPQPSTRSDADGARAVRPTDLHRDTLPT